MAGGFQGAGRCGARDYRKAVRRHLPWALLLGGVLLAVALLPPSGLPVQTCLALRLTGYPCPTCGWTRGLIGLAHGDWAAVWRDCPIAFLLYGATALAFAVHGAGLLCGVPLAPGRRLSRRARLAGAAFFGLLVLANWIYRLALGLA